MASEPVFAQSTTSTLSQLAVSTEQRLWEIKLAHRPKSFWYPYLTLNNVAHLEQLSSNVGLNLLELCQGEYGKVADIGAGDGDLAFFLESQGLSVDVIDNEETNFNSLKGVRVLKEALNSSINIRSVALGQTTISWSGGKVYVSMDGGKETLFAVRDQGSKVAHWIQAGRRYEFRLCKLGHTEILAKVVVSM